MGQRSHMSNSDLAKLRLLYKCPTRSPTTLECSSRGGQVGIVFTHDRFTPNAALFSTSRGSNSELVLTYVGTSSSFSSEDTQVVLMVQATEQRPDALVSTIPLVVTVSGVTTTTTTPEEA